MSTIKTNFVKEYLSNINFKNGDWSVEKIKEDLRKVLGEYPAIDIGYKRDVSINETTGKAIEIHNANRFTIVFTDENGSFRKIDLKL